MRRSLFRKISIGLPALVLLLTVSMVLYNTDSQAGLITPVQLNDYSSQFHTFSAGFIPCRATGLYKGLLVIKNHGVPIDGTLVVVLKNLPQGVTLVNAKGQLDGSPYILVTGGGGRGASCIPLSFRNPTRKKIQFTAKVNQLIQGAVNARAVRALSSPFTIAAIPDTQVYAEEN